MRTLVLALLLAAPAAALAQTPADLARQIWPAGAPASTSVAPAQPTPFASFDRGVSNGLWLRDAPLTTGVAPAAPLAAGGSFSGTDLALLRTGGERLEPTGQTPVIAAIVAADPR